MKFNRIVLILNLTCLSLLLAGCPWEEEGGGTQSPADTFSVNGVSFVESVPDTLIGAGYVSQEDRFDIGIFKGYEPSTEGYTEHYLFSFSGSTAGVYSNTGAFGVLLFLENGNYFSIADVASIITIEQVGEVGETVIGSYQFNLCPSSGLSSSIHIDILPLPDTYDPTYDPTVDMNYDFTLTCSVELVEFTGDFSITREADQ